jgi:sulfur carrier protein ThiS adenylyltransferase
MLTINEYAVPFQGKQLISHLAQIYKPGADLFILNGFPATPDTEVQNGDRLTLICKGQTPTPEELDSLLSARHTPGIQKQIKQASIAVLGLGGLGSAVAGAMAKIGIGKMLLSDYDVVEPSNLNRQHYFVDQIGMQKTLALRDNLLRMNPAIHLELIEKQLTETDIPELFSNVDVLVECFDDAAMKASAFRAVMNTMKDVSYVGSSGMAGFGENNSIITKEIRPGMYLVGDAVTAAKPGCGLMAPRVGIAAHHQANQALRIILGKAPGRN